MFHSPRLTEGGYDAGNDSDNEQAEAVFSRLVKQFSEKEGVTEALKAENQMLWVQRMNNIRSAAMEIVANDLIYCLEDGYECQAGRL